MIIVLEIFRWIMFAVGCCTILFVLYFIFTKQYRDPSDMDEKEFQEWHDKTRMGGK